MRPQKKHTKVFAFIVKDDSMFPFIPRKAVLYTVADAKIHNGDFVLAKIQSTRKIVVRRYARCGNTVTLSPVNPRESACKWDCKKQAHYVEWMHRITEIGFCRETLSSIFQNRAGML